MKKKQYNRETNYDMFDKMLASITTESLLDEIVHRYLSEQEAGEMLADIAKTYDINLQEEEEE